MNWKESFKPTKWKIILALMPAFYLVLLYHSWIRLATIYDPHGDTLLGIAVFGIAIGGVFFLLPPLNLLFCSVGLAQNCSGFMAIPYITLLGSIFLSIIDGIIIYSIYSLVEYIIKRYKDRKNSSPK